MKYYCEISQSNLYMKNDHFSKKILLQKKKKKILQSFDFHAILQFANKPAK